MLHPLSGEEISGENSKYIYLSILLINHYATIVALVLIVRSNADSIIEETQIMFSLVDCVAIKMLLVW